MKTNKKFPLTALLALTLSLDAFAMGPQPPAENTPAPTPPVRQETPAYPVSAFTAGNSLDLRTARDPQQFLGTWVHVMETCDLQNPASSGFYRESGLRYEKTGNGIQTITIRHVPIDLLPGGAQSQYFSRAGLKEVSFLSGGIADEEGENPIQIFENWVKISQAKVFDVIFYGKVRSQRACNASSSWGSGCPRGENEWSHEKTYTLGTFDDIKHLLESGEMQAVRAEARRRGNEPLFCGISASDSTLLICHDQAEPLYYGKTRHGCASAYRKVK